MVHQKSLQPFYASLFGFLLSVKQHLIAIARDYDLTFIQATTLMLVDEDTPKPMNSIQKLYSCDASNITGIIDGLEEKKLVSRGEDVHDRRVKIISLTDRGVKLRNRIYDDLIHVDPIILNGLTSIELAEFRLMITKLVVS
jgi:DNA-binding MarR family transcriptional regulator